MKLETIGFQRDNPNEFNAIIEVPTGGNPIKYEFDEESGALIVDRFLYTPMHYPGNYGFLPQTRSEDGDPCDVLLANSRPLFPGSIIAVRPIGVLVMVDEEGNDEKIIAVPSSHITKRYDGVHETSDLPPIVLKQIEHFFTHYKDLEDDKWVNIIRWGDSAEALAMIKAAHERYVEKGDK